MPVQQVGDQRGARYSTVFYGEDAGGLEVDLSQEATDLQTGTGGVVFESNTTRMDGTGRRAIRFRLTLSPLDEGTLWRHGTGAATGALQINGAGTLEAIVNNAVATSWVTLEWPSNPDQDVRIAWVTIDNPDTTGASDEMLSLFLFHNVTTGGTDRHWFTHERKDNTSATAYFGASDSGGTDAFDGTIEAVGFDIDVVSLSTMEHDWGAVIADVPADDGLTVRPSPPLPGSAAAGAPGEFFGLVPQWAALAHYEHRRRHFSPLVNERFPDPPAHRSSVLTTSDFWELFPDGSGYIFSASLLRYRPVPSDADVAWVRAHLDVSLLQPEPAMDVGVRCYSLDAHPFAPDLSDVRYVEHIGNTSDTAGHVLESLLPLARRDGLTWLVLAIWFDPDADAGSLAQVQVQISDWHVTPRALATPPGGLPLGGVDD